MDAPFKCTRVSVQNFVAKTESQNTGATSTLVMLKTFADMNWEKWELHKQSYDETDAWKIYTAEDFLIKNSMHETLVVYPESMDSCGLFESVQQQYQGTFRFKLHLYQDTNAKEGVPTVFTIQKGLKTYLMHCTEDRTLRFEEGSVPRWISGYKSKYIFYKRQFSEGDAEAFSFESSILVGYFLASEQEHGCKKLALRSHQHEVNENFRIQLVKV